MGFPGTSIDDLELVPEEDEMESTSEADESEDDLDHSNSKYLIIFLLNL